MLGSNFTETYFLKKKNDRTEKYKFFQRILVLNEIYDGIVADFMNDVFSWNSKVESIRCVMITIVIEKKETYQIRLEVIMIAS